MHTHYPVLVAGQETVTVPVGARLDVPAGATVVELLHVEQHNQNGARAQVAVVRFWRPPAPVETLHVEAPSEDVRRPTGKHATRGAQR